MLTRLKTNFVLATMVSLCLGTVVSADTSDASVAADPIAHLIQSPDFGLPLSQRAGALAVDLMLTRTESTRYVQANSSELDSPPAADAEPKRAGIISEIEMPFFSFGGLSSGE